MEFDLGPRRLKIGVGNCTGRDRRIKQKFIRVVFALFLLLTFFLPSFFDSCVNVVGRRWLSRLFCAHVLPAEDSFYLGIA
jgi:hypothetical protein